MNKREMIISAIQSVKSEGNHRFSSREVAERCNDLYDYYPTHKYINMVRQDVGENWQAHFHKDFANDLRRAADAIDPDGTSTP